MILFNNGSLFAVLVKLFRFLHWKRFQNWYNVYINYTEIGVLKMTEVAQKQNTQTNTNEVLDLIEKSRIALKEYQNATQEEVDLYVKTVTQSIAENALQLAEEAVEETGMGVVEHKIGKNSVFGEGVWLTMRGQKSVGIIEEDDEKNLIYVAHPKGVIGGILPSTNPTLSTVGKAMIALKGRNTLVIAPHPSAKNVTIHSVEIIQDALRKVGAPENLVTIIKEPTLEKSQELMKLSDTILATGGMGMVYQAYSSGKPAFGVGAGNSQVLIADDVKDLNEIARQIVFSSGFDNGIACAADESVLVPETLVKEFTERLVENGAYYSDDAETIAKFKAILFKEDGKLNPENIGKDAKVIAERAGVDIGDKSIIVLKADKFGADELLSMEKMSPVLALNTYDSFEDGLNIAKANLAFQGEGHTAVIYTDDKDRLTKAGLELPVYRLLHNVPGMSAVGVGEATHLAPSASVGCGAIGNNTTAENVTWKHLLDIKVIASPRKDVRESSETIWD